MKTNKLNKKLSLQKRTIANLSREEMKVFGGVTTDLCTVIHLVCQGESNNDCIVETDPYVCNSVTDCASLCQSVLTICLGDCD